MQAGDPSYWRDPSLSSSRDEWRTRRRPGIVIGTHFDRRSLTHKIKVVSLGRGTPTKGMQIIPVCAGLPSQPPLVVSGDAIVPDPAWKMPDTYCYAFRRPPVFHCLPTQPRHPAHWKIGPQDVKRLDQTFAPRQDLSLDFNDFKPTPKAGPDAVALDQHTRYEGRIRYQKIKFYVDVTPLSAETMNDDDIDWGGNRAWYDERVKIARRRGWETGWEWSVCRDDKKRWLDSYEGADMTQWGNCQDERDLSLTLDLDMPELHRGRDRAKLEVENVLEVV
jgi:hypothetical protein